MTGFESLHVRRPRKLDVYHVVDHMREWDRLEIYASFDSGKGDFATAWFAVCDKCEISYLLHTPDGEPCVLMNVVPAHFGRGFVQLVATARIVEIMKMVIRFLRHEFARMAELGFRRLECRALAAWEMNTRFLKAIGGEVETLLAGYGADGEDFLQIAWLNDEGNV